jgi:phage host-nuclease inhibitor protein Gam
VLIKRVALGRLIGEVEAAPRLCEARVRDQQVICQEHLQRQAGRHLERIKPLTERIEELQRIEDELTEEIAKTKERLRWWYRLSPTSSSADRRPS